MIHISNAQARRFLLSHHGLYGPPRFLGKQGILAFVRQAGCVQYDPVDIAGRSPELAFLSRVPDYHQDMLDKLLYRDRLLVDHFDKNLSIFPVEDWPCFHRVRSYYGGSSRGREEIMAARPGILKELKARGPLTAQELTLPGKVHWYWGPSSLARAALELLYFAGELCIAGKKGTLKRYDLAERCLPPHLLTAPDPYPDLEAHHAWRVKRRIRAVGLLWNRASDAWLGIGGMKAPQRAAAFLRLQEADHILPVKAEGLKDTLYVAREDLPRLEQALQPSDTPTRCALIAPLDSLMWDRRLISALFEFDSTWEIYTKPEKRRYGPYTLPVVYGDQFVGRLQPRRDRKEGTLTLDGLWWEEGARPDKDMKQALMAALKRLTKLNGVKAAIAAKNLSS